jgi:hypothetical protein
MRNPDAQHVPDDLRLVRVLDPNTMKRQPKQKWPVTAMTFVAPDGGVTLNPTLEALEPIIFGERNGYWRRGKGGNSAHSLQARRQESHEHSRGQAYADVFPRRAPRLFLHLLRAAKNNTLQFVPYSGGSCRPWVKHSIGRVTFLASRACFVSRPFAWEIVQEFLRSKGRSAAVPWADRFWLEFPNPAAGDEMPGRKDLA